MEKQGYVVLSDIINDALFQQGQAGTHKYFHFKLWALDALKKFHMDFTREIKTILIPMSPVKTIEFPKDYVNWCKVGVQIGDRVKVFIPDGQLALLYPQDKCGNDLPSTPAYKDDGLPIDSWYFFNYCDPYGRTGALPGYGDGRIENGFRINGTTIHFNSDIATSNVYLEYVSDGFNPTEQSVVPATCEMAIRAYIDWQSKRFDKSSGMGDIEEARMFYANELGQAKKRISPLTIEGILHASRARYGSPVKA